jgi:hypothetical protein
MVPHGLLAHRLDWAIPTCKPIDYRDNGLWRQPIDGQWDTSVAICKWEPLYILLDLPSQLHSHLMLVPQVSRNGGRLQCVLALAVHANQYIVLAIQCNQMGQRLGDGLGHGGC